MAAVSTAKSDATSRAGSNGHGRKKAEDFTSVRELRQALDEAISTGKQVPHDKPLVTRLI